MKSKIAVLFMMLSIWVLWAGAGFAYTPEGDLEVLVPGREARVTFQEIDDNKVLASVLDVDENPVKDLMTEDFKVIKGGIDAIVTNAEILKTRKDVPINYVLMVDNSFSMKDRDAVEPLLAALDEFLKIVRPIDEVDVLVFDGDRKFLVDGHILRLSAFKSNNINELKAFFQKSFSRNGMSKQTFLYEGILGGVHLVSKLPEKNNKFLVVFTDGEDLNSEINKDIIAPKAKELKNFKAFSIDFMPTEKKDAFLTAFSEATGGKCWKATSAANLLPIFQEVSTALLYQYVVEYTFVNPPQGTLGVYPSDVTIEELTIIDSSPLLNYIFFEAGQSAIPEHYRLLKTQAEAGEFDEKMLRDTMTKYYDVLNIIGKRLVENPEANVELVGCISDKGEEKNNLTLSRARAESVKSYLQYIWNIDPGRLIATARKLPEIPSTGRVQEGIVENQRVEIRSGSPAILDSIKSTYTFEVADSNEITIQPNIKPGYDLKEWKIEIKGDGTLLKSIQGQGNTIPDATFNLVEYGLSKIGAFKTLSTSATLTDITGQTFETDVFKTNVKYITRVESKAQKLEYKVVEKYALILFDFDSSAIKERNKTVIDRVTARIKELPDANVTILGQTDTIGTEDYNVALSVRRAHSVYQTVMDSGLSSPERVTSKGNGPHDPPYDNAGPEGRSFNRTVTITIEYEATE